MSITYIKPNGEWGIEGVDLSALPPQVYGALCKLCDIEHPKCPTRGEALRAMNDEQMVDWMADHAVLSVCDLVCGGKCTAVGNLRADSITQCREKIRAWVTDTADSELGGGGT